MRFEISFDTIEDQRYAESIGVDMCCGFHHGKKVVDLDEKESLEKSCVSHTVHHTYPDKELEDAPKNKVGLKGGFHFDGSLKGNYSYSELAVKLSELHQKYGPHSTKPVIKRWYVQGWTGLGNPIHVLQLGTPGKPAAFMSGCTHAREPLSMMCTMHFMFWLCENYQGPGDHPDSMNLTNHNLDAVRARTLVENFCIWVMPMCNPDGYIYNEQLRPHGSGMSRKNRNITLSKHCGLEDQGVDINRNYGISFGKHRNGSSRDPCSQFYKGEGAFSENESQAKRDFFGADANNTLTNEKNIRVALHNHSYGGYIKIPSVVEGSRYHSAYRIMGGEMSRYNKYVVGDALETVGYVTDGSEEVWTNNHNRGNFVYSFMPEIGCASDGFWPARDRLSGIAKDTLYMFQSAVAMCEDFPVITNVTMNCDGGFHPGQFAKLWMTVLNAGVQPCHDLAIGFIAMLPSGVSHVFGVQHAPGVSQTNPVNPGHHKKILHAISVFVPNTVIPGSVIYIVSYSSTGFPVDARPQWSSLVTAT